MANVQELFGIKRESGKLLLNSPLVLRVKCNGNGSIVDYYDDTIVYNDLQLIPLRVDETRDPHNEQSVGLLLAIAISGTKTVVRSDRKQQNPVTLGTTIYLVLRRGRGGKGPFDIFSAMCNRVEIETGRRMQGWLWMPALMPAKNKYGEFAICQWFVSEPEEKEFGLLQQIAEKAGANFCFEEILALNNEIVRKFDEIYIAVKQEQQQKLATAQPQLQPAAQ